MEQDILCLNGGSSSLKFAVYRMAGAAHKRVFSGAVEAVGAAGGKAWLRRGEKTIFEQGGGFRDHAAAVRVMFDALQQEEVKPAAAGHRIVHGGPKFSAPQRVDQAVRRELNELIAFAPLHLPGELAMIDAVSAHYPEMPQVACFDTAFHNHLPELAKRFPLPQELWEKGIRRYGFHGLSYEYVVSKLRAELGPRTIIAHLGNGASMVALKEGVPIDTSMGLTPMGGFMMGTRSGDLDPGVVLYLLRLGYSAEKLEELLNHRAGLLGVSAESSEMQVLLEKRSTDPGAELAVKMFCYQVRKFIGAYAAALGGLDSLVFTGGIGERAGRVRAEICEGLEHLGIAIEQEANDRDDEILNVDGGRCVVRVVQTDEDLMIARHTREILRGGTV